MLRQMAVTSLSIHTQQDNTQWDELSTLLDPSRSAFTLEQTLGAKPGREYHTICIYYNVN